MARIKQHFFQQRRRLAFVCAMSFLSGLALYAHINAFVFGLPFALLAGLMYAVGVTGAAAVTSYIFPGLTRLIDCMSVSRLGFALWVLVTQSYGMVASPTLSATVVVGGAIALMHLQDFAGNGSRAVPHALLAMSDRLNAGTAWLDGLEPAEVHGNAAVSGAREVAA